MLHPMTHVIKFLNLPIKRKSRCFLAAILALLASASCENAISLVNSIQPMKLRSQGQWLEHSSLFAGQEGKMVRTSHIRVKVGRSVWAKSLENIDFQYIGVYWFASNVDKEPATYAWENKYLMDERGAIYSPFMGQSSPSLQPGIELREPLTIVYRIPASITPTSLVWGRHVNGISGLDYGIKLMPEHFLKLKPSGCKESDLRTFGGPGELEPYKCF